MSDLPQLDTAEVATACRRRAGLACGEHASFAIGVLDRLEPSRWALEWHLPWWLSAHLGVPQNVGHELVVSNVLGLAAVRLRDDLRDGDVPPRDAAVATDVAAALHEAALSTYRALFAPGSPIWAEIALRMAEWESATADGAASSTAYSEHAVARQLAGRGAPLKICVRAVCLLAGRNEVVEPLSRYVDHVVAAMTLLDHLCDWPEDLAAGRWNAFAGRRTRSEVIVAMMTTDALSAYSAGIQLELDRAAALADELESAALADHVTAIRAQIDAHAARLEAHYRSVTERAVALMFGSAAV